MDTTRLTPRQREVLALLAKRYSNQQIADALGISLDGAKWHVREVLQLYGVDSREEAAERYRIENGLPRRLWRMRGAAVASALIAGGAAFAAAAIVVLAVRGGEGDDSPSPSVPVAEFTVTATAIGIALTPTPGGVTGFLLPPSRATGQHFVDYVTAHLESNVPLEPDDFAGQSLPCSDEAYITAPPCPSGAAVGTPVLSIITFQCEIGWNVLTPDPQLTHPDDRRALYSVVEGGLPYTRPPAAEAVPDYWMLFKNAAPNLPPGFAVAVKDDKIVSFGRSCGTFESLEARRTAGSTGYLLPSP